MKVLKRKYYQTAKETPLSVFMDILDGAPLTRLERPGGLIQASPEKLSKAWNSIYFEFLDLVKSLEYLHKFHTVKQIAKLNTIKAVLVNLKFNARVVKDPNFSKLLNKAGIFPKDRKLSPAKIEKLIEARLKTIDLDLRKLESGIKNDAPIDKPKDGAFIESLVNLSKLQGYRIDPEKTSVAEFAVMIKNAEKLKENGKDNRNNRRGGV